ncbi:Cyclic nucleotide-binding domain-containing protein [Alkalispirochaeta americana]|uniref:Cyclic nucleotide-binding domain-containing protein n=1 Tax=Alkalispirochaeta americana TaxID=159291 RepID=A0A1N6U4H5_9SPIO|nr:cyclic nucleotide-binding domain-containing protein [Alkalispirochaeta americana]SIQ60493.1 Cyclic nucleotide-binding domain-containing protein [Alkalispirochaeta americana]
MNYPFCTVDTTTLHGPKVTVSTSFLRDRALLLLAGQAFFTGLSFGLLFNVAYTLLVVEFGSAGLRTVYVLVGVTVPFFTIGFNALEGKLHLARTSLIVTALFTVLFFLAYFALLFLNLSWVIYALMVMNTMGTLYLMMLRGSQAVEIYDARTIKNRYPKITGGEILAVVLAGIMVGPLTTLTGSLERLLIVGGVSMTGAFLMVLMVVGEYIGPAEARHHAHRHEQSRRKSDHGVRAFLAILGKRYTLLVFGYQMITSMISLLVQYIVYSQAQRFFLTQSEMSQFIGLAKSGTTAVSFLFLSFAAGRLLIRFGMPLGLAGSPAGVSVMLVAALVAGLVEGTPGRWFFILVVVSQFVDYAMYSGFVKTSIQSAFQPLPPKERDIVHTFAQGIGIPVSYGLAGLLLVSFARMTRYTPTVAAYLTLIVTGLCGVVGFFLYRAYSAQLRKTLSRRNIGEMELNLEDASTMQVVDRLLEAQDPWILRSGLDLLEKAAHPSYTDRIRDLLERPLQTEARRDLLERIERAKPAWGKDAAERAVLQSDDTSLRSAGIRALCATVDEPASSVSEYLESPSPEIRSAAVSGLFLYGGINGILQAGNVFNSMLGSSDIQERVEAASILERTGIRNFYHPLIGLLKDPSESVVTASLKAAGMVCHPALIPEVLPWIDPVSTRAEAISALVRFEGDLLPWLKRCLEGDPEIPFPRSIRMIRLCARISDPRVGTLLEEALMTRSNGEMAATVQSALSQRGYRAVSPETRKRVLERILENSEKAARILVATHLLEALHQEIRPLISALQDQYRRQEDRIFTLCTLLYNPDEIMGARGKIMEGTAKQKALASEMLDVLLEPEIKRHVIAVIENTETGDIPLLRELFGLSVIDGHGQIQEILTQNDLWPEQWLRTCAEYAAAVTGIAGHTLEESMLTTIERVMTLKAADIFSTIPDAVLAHIASIGEDVDAPPKETFIKKGEMGDCMYIIREGRVSVHDETRSFAELGPGQVVGEMAVLDPEPRSASVTALEETSLLKIEKDAFDSVMADHPGIARGVIHVLCNRLRNSLKK